MCGRVEHWELKGLTVFLGGNYEKEKNQLTTPQRKKCQRELILKPLEDMVGIILRSFWLRFFFHVSLFKYQNILLTNSSFKMHPSLAKKLLRFDKWIFDYFKRM